MGDNNTIKTYGYRCNGCGLVFDETVYFDERDKVRCQECGETTDRLLSAPYVAKHTMPYSRAEKGMKADLLMATKIEESLAYGDLRKADERTKTEAKKEAHNRTHEAKI